MVFSRTINISKHNHGADLNTKSKARELRKRMTQSEALLWEKLRKNKLHGLHFRRQHPYGMYIIDFFCNKINLAIEIDGEIHKFKREQDKEKDEYLKNAGIRVLRFSNKEVINNIEDVLKRICKFIEENTS